MPKPRIVIIGAGPAGLGAAYKLTHQDLAHVTVIERSENVGGMVGSFELSGIQVDYGSHRLHPSCDPEVFRDLKTLLGNDLMALPRHGRIRLYGKWIHFPLKPFELAFRLPPRFLLGVAADFASKTIGAKDTEPGEETFASVLKEGLGQTVFTNFYAPYASKIWGVPPEKLSARQAYRRISALSLRKMAQRIISAAPGVKTQRGGRFFYHPRNGFGQISESLFQAAKRAGAEFCLGAQMRSLMMNGEKVSAVSFEMQKKLFRLQADYVWSTIPISNLIGYLSPSVPPAIIRASQSLKYRSMIFVYIALAQERFSEYDAHYFPEKGLAVTRLSEPKNYNAVQEPGDCTILCAELPCSVNEPEWAMSDQQLGKLVCRCLKSADIPVVAPIKDVVTRRLENAYPIYPVDYENNLDRIDQWLGRMKNLLSFGRHGSFAHDNIHHSLSMAYAAVKCLDGQGGFDRTRWQNFQKIFDTFVVED